jgi:hypothetical protein
MDIRNDFPNAKPHVPSSSKDFQQFPMIFHGFPRISYEFPINFHGCPFILQGKATDFPSAPRFAPRSPPSPPPPWPPPRGAAERP